MTLTRIANPWRPSIIDRFFEGEMDYDKTDFAGVNSTMPAINIKENADGFMIEVAAPGMRKEDFQVNYDNGRLLISAEHNNENHQKDGEKITRQEFRYGSFQRSFTIKKEIINAEHISAKYENGILYLTLPKREEVKPKPAKQIQIM